MSHGREAEHEPSYIGIYFTFFAGGLLIVTGLIMLVYGIFGLGGTVGRSTDIPVHIGPNAWAVLHILGGALLVAAGWNVFQGRLWARAFGIAVASLVILASLMSLEAYTFFAGGLIVLNLFIVWALMRRDTAEAF